MDQRVQSQDTHKGDTSDVSSMNIVVRAEHHLQDTQAKHANHIASLSP